MDNSRLIQENKSRGVIDSQVISFSFKLIKSLLHLEENMTKPYFEDTKEITLNLAFVISLFNI